MKEYIEKTIICKDCGKDFKLSIGEQKFYEEKGLAHPTRCNECRQKRKASFENKGKAEEKTITSSKKAMTQEEIEAVLKKWRENTVYFPEKHKKGKSKINKEH